jgi:hypothetical protein
VQKSHIKVQRRRKRKMNGAEEKEEKDELS